MLRSLISRLKQLDHLTELRHIELEKLSPIEKFCALQTRRRFTGDYELWRVNRIRKVVELMGVDWDWQGKSVLELGAGYGEMGAFFADAGADVTLVDGRVENLCIAKLRYQRKLPDMKFVHRDVEADISDLGRFDVIIHFGLLYHISDVEKNIAMCTRMSDRIFLETEVLDSQDDREVRILHEDLKNYDTGLASDVSMISPFYIKRVFEENGMDVDIISDRSLNAGVHVYDWAHNNDSSWMRHRRRFFHARAA